MKIKIKKSVLRETVREIIREAKGIKDESAASDQAKQQGLSSAGFGRYKDKSGKVVAKSQGGQLVKVGGEKQPTQQAPTAKSEPATATKSEPTATAPAQKPAAKPEIDWKNVKIPIKSGEGYSHKYDKAERPKRMKAIDVSKYPSTKNSQDRPVDYGHCNQIFVDKYGKEAGEAAYEKLFVDSGNNFGWSLAGKIQQEKRSMIQALGMEQPRDLDDVAYYPLWRKWQAKEGIDQVGGTQKTAPKSAPVSSPVKEKPIPTGDTKPKEKEPEKYKNKIGMPKQASVSSEKSFLDTPEFDQITKQLSTGKMKPERYKQIMTAMMNLKENVQTFKKVIREQQQNKAIAKMLNERVGATDTKELIRKLLVVLRKGGYSIEKAKQRILRVPELQKFSQDIMNFPDPLAANESKKK